MQMNEQVLTALEVLRNFAENDFERHRIDVLEKDLTDPPKAEIIDDNHQKFNGVTYFKKKDNHYYSTKGIQRAIWEYYYGKIPKGCHVHHRNLNPEDNAISNFQLLTRSEHKTIHWQKQSFYLHVCKCCNKRFLSKKATALFCSRICREKWQWQNGLRGNLSKCPVCGREFIPQHANQICCSHTCATQNFWKDKKNPPALKKCPSCGKVFTLPQDHPEQVCCSYSCAAKLRWKDKTKPQFEKICPICGKTFFTTRAKQGCCSKSCSARFYWQNKNPNSEIVKECPICNKTFVAPKGNPEKICCSYLCAAKLRWQNKNKNQQ